MKDEEIARNKIIQVFLCFCSLYTGTSGNYLIVLLLSLTAQGICKVTTFFRQEFPNTTFPPRMHMLEDDVVNCIFQKWPFSMCFLGKQG